MYQSFSPKDFDTFCWHFWDKMGIKVPDTFLSSSFEELYEVSPTFRRLADDQGIVISTLAV